MINNIKKKNCGTELNKENCMRYKKQKYKKDSHQTCLLTSMTNKQWDSIVALTPTVWKQKSLELFPVFTCELKHYTEHGLMAYATSKDDTETMLTEHAAKNLEKRVPNSTDIFS